MKHIFLIGCLLVWGSLAALAQKPYQTPEQRANHQTQRFTEELQLSEEQQTRVKNAALVRINKIEKAQEHVHKRVEIRHAVDEFENSMKVILTADQYTKFKESEHRSPEEKAEAQAHYLVHHLQLNEEQSHKVRDAVLTRIEKTEEVREIHKNGSQKEATALKVVLDEFHATMQQILTPEQFSKFEQMLGERKEKVGQKKGKKGKKTS